MAKSIETRTQSITFGEDAILRCRVKATDDHTLNDAVENIQACARLTDGARVPTLLGARLAKKVSREAREYYAGPENAKVTIATAMLIGSAVGRVIGNFLIQVNRPSFPLRLFSHEAEAVAWLEEIRRQLRV